MEILLLISIIFLGIISGIITGLIPGVHINLIASIILTNSIFLLNILDVKYLIIYIITMGVTHSFIDFIPSVLFGVSSSDNALSILPAHKMTLEGRSFEAIYLSGLGSLIGSFTAILISPIFYIFLSKYYSQFKIAIPYLLITIIIYFIQKENNLNKKFWATIIVVFSISYGLFLLNSYHIKNPLLVIFSGLFGISSIINSLLEKNTTLPKQTYNINFKKNKLFLKSITIGTITSAFCSVMPGIGNAQAGNFASIFVKKLTSKYFIIILSTINTVNFILSFTTLYTISKARNGAVLVISQITEKIKFQDLILYFIITIIVSIIGFYLMLKLGKLLIEIISKLNQKIINFLVLILISTIVLTLCGFLGFLAMVGATALALLSLNLNLSRVHLMSIIIGPVIFNLL